MNTTQPVATTTRHAARSVLALAGLVGTGALALSACTPTPAVTTYGVPAAQQTTAVPAVATANPSTSAAPATTAASATTAAGAPATVPATAATGTTATRVASASAPAATAPVTVVPPAAPATNAPMHASCLPDLGVCFLPSGGTWAVDNSKRSVDGWTSNDLVFKSDRLGADIARVSASNQGGGIGGGCQPGSMGTATVVASVKTQLATPSDATHSDGMYAVQIVVPDPNGHGWLPRTFLTTTKAATQVGDVDACSIMMADIASLGPGSVPVWSYAGTVEPMKLQGVTREEALQTLAGPVHQEALKVFATAYRS